MNVDALLATRRPESGTSGRAFVQSYVEYIHYIEGLYEATTSAAHGHYPEAEPAAAGVDPHKHETKRPFSLQRVFIGGTAEQIVRHAPCSVLVGPNRAGPKNEPKGRAWFSILGGNFPGAALTRFLPVVVRF